MAKSATAVNRDGTGRSTASSGRATFAIGVFMLGTAFALSYALLNVWPNSTVENGATVWINLTESTALGIAMICGALGAYVHVATSFASYAGNRTLSSSWIWWFLLRPAIGAALALMAYFIMRSGVLLNGPLGELVSPPGIAALSAICGLFSKQVIDKVKNVSDTAFNTAQDAERHDKL